MGRVKHNWEKYKQDYFDSPHDEIKKFFGSFKEDVPERSYHKKTQGWKSEKLAYKRKQSEAARKKLEQDPDVTSYKIQIKKAANNVVKRVANMLQKDDLSIVQIKAGWEILKTELGEVTKISDQNFAFREKPAFKQVKL